jgi:hypothetical protein
MSYGAFTKDLSDEYGALRSRTGAPAPADFLAVLISAILLSLGGWP